jgi:Fic family protein
LADLLLARSDEISQRFYSMSTQIKKERNEYYIEYANQILEKVFFKHHFLNSHATSPINERQSKIIQKMLPRATPQGAHDWVG